MFFGVGGLNLNLVKNVRVVFRLVLGWSVVGVVALGSARGLGIDSWEALSINN